MKKIYSLFAAVVMAVAVNAQIQTVLLDEDFSSITTGSNTTTAGSNTGWSGNGNFPTVSTAYQAGGAVRIGSSSRNGSLTTKALDLSIDDEGVFTVQFDVKGWTTVEGDITVSVTGLDAQTTSYTAVRTSSTYDKISLVFTGGQANSTVTIATTARRAFIDNVKITPGTLSVTNINVAKKTLVKNTQVANELVFATKSDVKIINMNGQVVKSVSVNENTSVNVSELPKGVYIVTGNVAGQTVSQKVIKK